MPTYGKTVTLTDGTLVEGTAALDVNGNILTGTSTPSSTATPTKYGKAVTLADGTIVQGTCLLDVNGNILTPGGGGAGLTQDPTSTSTTLAMSANATQQAIVNAYTGNQSFRGGYDASVGTFPATGGSGSSGTIRAGDYWVITAPGTLGGVPYVVDNEVLALINLPGQTAANWTNIGNAGSLASLTDVQIATPTTNQNLVYNGTKWANRALTKTDVGLSNVQNVDTTNASNINSGTLPAAQLPALTGDVTTVAGSANTTIAAKAVTNAKMADAPGVTLKGNANSTADTPADLTPAQVTAILNAFTGDSGAGGAKGLVPAPAAGDAAAGKVLGASGAWVSGGATSLNTKVFYVSYGSGSDSNNGLSVNTPFKTLSAACTAAGNSGNQICVLPGTDPNNYTITNQNLSITGVNSEKRGICSYTGTITVAGTASSISISGLSIGTLVHSGAGGLYLYNTLTNTALSNTGTGYTEMSGCDSSNGTVSNTGAAMMNFLAGCKVGTATMNNASGALVLNGCIGSNPVTVTAGTLISWNMAISSATATGNAITASSGAIVVCYYSQCLTPAGNPARINVAAGANYVFTGVVYDTVNSTVAGTPFPNTAVFGNIQGNLATSYLTGTLQAAQEPAHSGDVTNPAGSLTMTIANGAVTNAKMANMAANTFKGNNTGTTAAPTDIPFSALTASLTPATSSSLGVVKVGPTLNVDGTGLLSLPQDLSTNANPLFQYVVTQNGYVMNDGSVSPKQVTIKAPATLATNYALQLPTALPTASGQVLSCDTAGQASWTTPVNNSGTIQAVLNSTLLTGAPVRLLPDGKVDGLATSTTGNNYNIANQNPVTTNGSVTLAMNQMLHCTMNDGRLVRVYAASNSTTWYAQIGTAGTSSVVWGAAQQLATGRTGCLDLQPCGASGFAFMPFSGNFPHPYVYVQAAAVDVAGTITVGNSVQVLGGNTYSQVKLCDMTLNGTGYFCSAVTYNGGESLELSSFTFNSTTGAITRIGNGGVSVNFGVAPQGWAGQNLALVRYSNVGIAAFMVGSGTGLMYANFTFNTNSYATVVTSSPAVFNWVNQSTYGLPGCLKAVCISNGGATQSGTIVMASTTLNTSATPVNIGVIQIAVGGALTSPGGTLAPTFTTMSAPTELEIVTNGSSNFFATFRSGSSAYAVSGYASGTTATLGSQVTLGTTYQPGAGGANTYNSGNLTVSGSGTFCYFQYDTNYYASVTQFFAGNTTSYDISNYIGILQSGGAAGSTQTVTIAGGTSGAQSGLTTQATYYLNPNTGTIGLTPTMCPVGKAISSSGLLLTSPIWQGGQIVNYTPTAINATIAASGGATKATVDETGGNAGRFVVTTGNLQRLVIDAAGKATFNNNVINLAASNTPATSTASGTLGDICYDSGYIYVCVAPNTWKRASLTTF